MPKASGTGNTLLIGLAVIGVLLAAVIIARLCALKAGKKSTNRKK